MKVLTDQEMDQLLDKALQQAVSNLFTTHISNRITQKVTGHDADASLEKGLRNVRAAYDTARDIMERLRAERQ